MVDRAGVTDGVVGTVGMLGNISRWISESVNGVISWVGRLSMFEIVMLLFVLVLTLLILKLRHNLAPKTPKKHYYN